VRVGFPHKFKTTIIDKSFRRKCSFIPITKDLTQRIMLQRIGNRQHIATKNIISNTSSYKEQNAIYTGYKVTNMPKNRPKGLQLTKHWTIGQPRILTHI